MKTSILTAVFLGCFLIGGTNAIIPMLGEAANHPLFFWGPQHLILLFDMNSTLGQQCMDTMGFAAVNSLTGVFKCSSALTDMATGDGIPSPASMCSSITSFSTCFHEEAMNIADSCEFSEEQRQFLVDAVKNNQDITESLCDDGASPLMQYTLNQGMECAATQQGGLFKCLQDNAATGLPMYNDEGCRHARNYAECAAAQISECNSVSGDIVKQVMEYGLHNVCEPDGGSGQLPPVDYEVSYDDEEGDGPQEQGGNREHRSKKEKLMKKQTDLLEDIRDLLQTVVESLSKHEELLKTIAEE